MASIKLYLIAMLLLGLYTTSSAPDISGVGCSAKIDGYPGCEDLELNATIHFSFNPYIPSLSVLFVASPPTPKGWVGWGINLKGSGMIGAETLAAFRSNNIITVNTYRLKAHNYVIAAKLSLELWDVRAEEIGDIFKIYATIRIPNNMKSLNHTWNTGPSVTEKGELEIHSTEDPHLKSKGELILSEGIACAVRDTAIKLYQISYKLGWTIFFFASLVIEQYVYVYPSAHPWWFYLHAGFQVGGYAVGAYSWGISMILASETIEFSIHRTIGTVIFIFATAILIYELFFMPNKDHRNRSCWNLAHSKIGYLVILFGVVHVFRGFKVFGHEETWKSWYSAIVSSLFAMVVLLEFLTCTTRTS